LLHRIAKKPNFYQVSAEPSKNYSQPSKSNGFRAVREKKVTDENPIASASGSSFQKDGTAGNRKKDLAALFRPPVEIMFLGDWDKVLFISLKKIFTEKKMLFR
jgi:hypothetical protein